MEQTSSQSLQTYELRFAVCTCCAETCFFLSFPLAGMLLQRACGMAQTMPGRPPRPGNLRAWVRALQEGWQQPADAAHPRHQRSPVAPATSADHDGRPGEATDAGGANSAVSSPGHAVPMAVLAPADGAGKPPPHLSRVTSNFCRREAVCALCVRGRGGALSLQPA
jgi:hypothetical protein